MTGGVHISLSCIRVLICFPPFPHHPCCSYAITGDVRILAPVVGALGKAEVLGLLPALLQVRCLRGHSVALLAGWLALEAVGNLRDRMPSRPCVAFTSSSWSSTIPEAVCSCLLGPLCHLYGITNCSQLPVLPQVPDLNHKALYRKLAAGSATSGGEFPVVVHGLMRRGPSPPMGAHPCRRPALPYRAAYRAARPLHCWFDAVAPADVACPSLFLTHADVLFSPAELLVALHALDPARDGVPPRLLMAAVDAALHAPDVFPQQAIAQVRHATMSGFESRGSGGHASSCYRAWLGGKVECAAICVRVCLPLPLLAQPLTAS